MNRRRFLNSLVTAGTFLILPGAGRHWRRSESGIIHYRANTLGYNGGGQTTKICLLTPEEIMKLFGLFTEDIIVPGIGIIRVTKPTFPPEADPVAREFMETYNQA